MVDLTDRPEVFAWLSRLAIRCVPRDAEAHEIQLRTFTNALAPDFQPRTFCEACLEDLARQFDWFPPYSSLRKALVKWLDKNPIAKRVPGPDLPDMAASDRCMVGFWHEYRAGEKSLPSGVTLKTWLSMCREHCEGAFRHICQTDLTAAEIAVKAGWMREPRLPPDEAEIAAVHSRVQEIIAGFAESRPPIRPPGSPEPKPGPRPPTAQQASDVRADDGIVAPSESAPEPALPPTMAERFEAKHGRPLGALSPEALKEMRMANPALKAVAERLAVQEAARTLAEQARQDMAPAVDPPIPPPTPPPPLKRPPLIWGEHEC